MPWQSNVLYIVKTSDKEWATYSVLLNPVDSLSSKHGFRAPEEGKVFLDAIGPSRIITIPLDTFVHTQTGEKFSIDQYSIQAIKVTVEVKHDGKSYRKVLRRVNPL